MEAATRGKGSQAPQDPRSDRTPRCTAPPQCTIAYAKPQPPRGPTRRRHRKTFSSQKHSLDLTLRGNSPESLVTQTLKHQHRISYKFSKYECGSQMPPYHAETSCQTKDARCPTACRCKGHGPASTDATAVAERQTCPLCHGKLFQDPAS